MIGVIVNPNSRKNRRRRGRTARLEKILGRGGRVIETPSVDAIVPALRRFADEGRRYWVADGGDGSLHWIINEAVRYFGPQRATELAVYVPTGGGSVDFVAKHLDVKGAPDAVIARLASALNDGHTPRLASVQSLLLQGEQVAYGDERTAFRRIGFGNALGGYGANFYGPLYANTAGTKDHGPARIARLMGAAFGAAALGSAFRGPLELLKPPPVARAEHEFLRPLRAEIRVDGTVLRGDDGLPVRAHTALNCASLPLNLANILRVFPQARDGRMHVHAGNVTATEMARVFPGLMSGRSVNHLLPNAYDGPATTLDVRCDEGEEMTPVIDGELHYRVTDLHVSLGPAFRMAAP